MHSRSERSCINWPDTLLSLKKCFINIDNWYIIGYESEAWRICLEYFENFVTIMKNFSVKLFSIWVSLTLFWPYRVFWQKISRKKFLEITLYIPIQLRHILWYYCNFWRLSVVNFRIRKLDNNGVLQKFLKCLFVKNECRRFFCMKT